MAAEIRMDLNDVRVVRDKQDRDALLAMLFGAASVLSLTMTALIGASFLRSGGRTAAFWLIVLTLIGSLVCLFVGKRNERWYVVCSLLNHMGIGLALFLVLEAVDVSVRPFYLALSGLPACAGLCGACLLFRGVDGQVRVRTVVIGAVALGLLAIVSIVLAVKTRQELWIGSAVSSVACCATCCGMAWSASKPDRSVYWTMAVVSFAIYILMILVAIVLFVVGAAANSSGSSREKSSGSKRRSSDSRSAKSASVSRPLARSRSRSWFYYPLFMSSRRRNEVRSNPVEVYSDDVPDESFDSYEAYRKRDRRNLRILLAILLTLFAAVLVIAIVAV